MNTRTTLIPILGALLIAALFLTALALGGSPDAAQAAQETATATVQAANTPATSPTARATTTPRATTTTTADDDVEATQETTPTLQTGPVITLTTTGQVNTERTITVVGEGRVEAEPDQAQLTIGVETVDTSVQDAVEQNNQQMEAVIAALVDQGVSQSNIQTANYSIFTETPGPDLEAAQETTPTLRYRVTQQVNITVTDLDTVSDVLDAAVTAGANNIFGVSFSIGDTTPLESQARREALENAFRSAQDVAALAGVELGGVVSITEVLTGPPTPFQGATEGLGGAAAPIQPGQFTFTKQLQVAFSIQ